MSKYSRVLEESTYGIAAWGGVIFAPQLPQLIAGAFSCIIKSKEGIMEAKTKSATEACKLQGAMWGAMSIWSKTQGTERMSVSPDMTHVEVIAKDFEVSELQLCACFCESDEMDILNYREMDKLYQDFFEFFLPLYEEKVFPNPGDIRIIMGFNYSNPGVIKITKDECTYSAEDNILNYKCNGFLKDMCYKVMDKMEITEIGDRKFYKDYEAWIAKK